MISFESTMEEFIRIKVCFCLNVNNNINIGDVLISVGLVLIPRF